MRLLWIRWLDASEHHLGDEAAVTPGQCERVVWQDIGWDLGKDRERQFLGLHRREDLADGCTRILAVPLKLILERRVMKIR